MKKIFPQEPPTQCEHFKTNGIRCGSPALNRYKLCFFHQRMMNIQQFRRERPNSRLDFPLLEDANAVQISVQDVLAAVAEDRLDPRRAGLLLYGLNTATCNLRNVDFEPKALRQQFADSESPVIKLLLEAMNREPEPDKKLPSSGSTEESPKALAG